MVRADKCYPGTELICRVLIPVGADGEPDVERAAETPSCRSPESCRSFSCSRHGAEEGVEGVRSVSGTDWTPKFKICWGWKYWVVVILLWYENFGAGATFSKRTSLLGRAVRVHLPCVTVHCQLSITRCQFCIVHCQFCIVHCQLSIVHCPLSNVYCPLPTVFYLPYFVHSPPSTIRCQLSTVHHPLSTIHCPLSTIHCPLSTIHDLLSTVYCPVHCPISTSQAHRMDAYSIFYEALVADSTH